MQKLGSWAAIHKPLLLEILLKKGEIFSSYLCASGNKQQQQKNRTLIKKNEETDFFSVKRDLNNRSLNQNLKNFNALKEVGGAH